MCCHCGYVHRSNRRSQSRFLCRACGFELNADLILTQNRQQQEYRTLCRTRAV
ncbi:MAG: hypothetical protein C4337_07090 [Armatimonadota bacterium]